MTLTKVIDTLNRLKPSALSDDDIIDMINQLESEIAETVLFQPFVPLDNTMMDTPLMAPAPYERIYTEYMSAQIDLINGNIEAYSLSGNQFNNDYEDMKRFCIRTGLTPVYNAKRSDYF